MADYTITAANVKASTFAKRFIPTPTWVYLGNPPLPFPALCFAGETLTAGQPVYQAVDNLFYRADANGVDPLYKVVGVTEHAALAGQPISIAVEDPYFTPGCPMVIGDVIILSATVGRIAPASDAAIGMFVSQLMVAWSTTQAELKITRSDAVKVA